MKDYRKNVRLALVCFLLVVVLNFFLPRLLPGNPVAYLTGFSEQDMTPAQAGKLAEKIAQAVQQISEVEEAKVVVNNGRALVAVKFDAQYSAGLDDRMKQQIIQTVQKVDDTLKDVEVTDDDTLYGQIKGLGERVANVTGMDELADDFGDLWDRIVGR